jgi:CheY-like chemotaxis protein
MAHSDCSHRAGRVSHCRQSSGNNPGFACAAGKWIVIENTGGPRKEGEPARHAAQEAAAPQEPAADSDERVLRVLLVDDHKIVRQGLESVLADEPDLRIVGQAGNGREAVDLACQLRPDVVVMDVSMPVMPGDEATRQIKLQLPQTRVVALSMHDDARIAERMRRAGAAAYLIKTAPSQDLLAAIRGRDAAARAC